MFCNQPTIRLVSRDQFKIGSLWYNWFQCTYDTSYNIHEYIHIHNTEYKDTPIERPNLERKTENKLHMLSNKSQPGNISFCFQLETIWKRLKCVVNPTKHHLLISNRKSCIHSLYSTFVNIFNKSLLLLNSGTVCKFHSFTLVTTSSSSSHQI